LVSWNAVELGRLDQYSSMIGRYCERYGAACWLQIYQADVRCRGEHMERLRRRGDEARATAIAAGGTHPMDPARPWDWVWGEACSDATFWRTELEEPVLLALTRGRTGIASQNLAPTPSGKRVVATDDIAPPAKAAKVHSVDGNLFRTNRRGSRLCTAFNEGKRGQAAKGGTCPNDQSAMHQCSRCLSDAHGAHACARSDYPATKAPANRGRGGGRGRKGAGKGSGKGKWQF